MLLVDTHVLLAVMRKDTAIFPLKIRTCLTAPGAFYVSVVSLWEIAIKARLGKLALPYALHGMADDVRRLKFDILSIDERHVLALVAPAPATRDPFDRLLLAQCQVEGMRLVTVDRALARHPLTV